MTDGIIKGTGNSRYIKTVANALALYSTYESFMNAFIAGEIPIDLFGINPSGWEQTGTALSKANLLTDALCTALSLPTTATPTEAMEKLRTLVNTAQSTANSKGYVQSGTYSGTNGKTLSLTFSIYPTIVIVSNIYKIMIMMKNRFGGYATTSNYSGPFYPVTVNISGKTWASYTDSSMHPLNESNYNYTYIAIG